MTENILDARDRFLGSDTDLVLMHRDDVADLARLRVLERDIQRPVVELLYELERNRRVVAAVEEATAKVVEHEAKGYKYIRLGVWNAVRKALEQRR